MRNLKILELYTLICLHKILGRDEVAAFTPMVSERRIRILSMPVTVMSMSEIPTVDAELVDDEGNDNEEYEWMTDREKARIRRENAWKPAGAADPSSNFYAPQNGQSPNVDDLLSDSSSSSGPKKKRLTYTDEEEELIEILGGKEKDNPSHKREIGFLGDSTLKEIAMDFQVPICYLADVLCGWGVPAPLDPNGLLGDMVTGEQAFAILEAIHTLDVGSLNDRYADYDLATLCNEYDIELTDGFTLAMKEGWNLPFGVRTFLHVEQEEHLVQTLAKDLW